MEDHIISRVVGKIEEEVQARRDLMVDKKIEEEVEAQSQTEMIEEGQVHLIHIRLSRLGVRVKELSIEEYRMSCIWKMNN